MKCCNCNCVIEHTVAAIAMEPNRKVFACSVPCAEQYTKDKQINEGHGKNKPMQLNG